jgi:hypothetical protein
LALFVGAVLIDDRGASLTGDFKVLWGPLSAFFIGLLICVLVLGLGGPTGEHPPNADDAIGSGSAPQACCVLAGETAVTWRLGSRVLCHP